MHIDGILEILSTDDNERQLLLMELSALRVLSPDSHILSQMSVFPKLGTLTNYIHGRQCTWIIDSLFLIIDNLFYHQRLFDAISVSARMAS